LPSELLDLTSEIVVWLILGIVLLAHFSELGTESFHVSSRMSIATIAGHIATVVNIVGSRRVDVCVDLPRMSIVGGYRVILSGRSIFVESNRDSVSCLALYPCISKILESDHQYLARFSGGRVAFEEA